MNKKRLNEDIDKTIKLMGLNLIAEGSGGGTGNSGGGTSTSSSGQFVSTGAWGEDPFNGNGREEDIGDLPSEVDITGGSVGGFETILRLLGDPENPHHDKKDPTPGDYTTKMDDTPCCEPCGDGMWRRCDTDDCVFGSISDCELDGEALDEGLEKCGCTVGECTCNEKRTVHEGKKPKTTFNI